MEALPAALECLGAVPPSTEEEVRAAESLDPTLVVTVEASDELSWVLTQLSLTDGLPVIAPTEDRVARMLAYCTRDPDATVGPIPPISRQLTVRAAAANAVMAGCRPPELPVLLQAMEAMLGADDVNFAGMQTTTHPIGPMLLICGPVARELGVASGTGCLGPGPWANGTLGRGLRLMCMNGGGAYPGGLDRATTGQQGKFTFCFAENEADSPWPSYREEHGFSDRESTITLVGAEAPTNINDHGSTTATGILDTISGTMASAGNNNMYWLGDTFVVIGPEHAETLAREGLSKQDVQMELHKRARYPVERMSAGQFAHIRSWIALDEVGRFVDENGNVPLTRLPEDIHLIVAGGPGKHSVWIPTWFRSVTRVIVDDAGESVASIDQLRRRTP
jgi:hypothetical protein